MFDNLKAQPTDKIMALMQMYREDTREGKIDLGVGVYKNALGVTPVMRAVKTAEKKLWDVEGTKSYTALAGDPGFCDALSGLVLGDARDTSRLSMAAQPGGTGAIHQAVELIKSANADATVWLSAPTWPNHPSILKHLGVPTKDYRYFDAETRGVDFDGMMQDLAGAKAGDVVLLHGCCHNPTGANLTIQQWQDVVDLLNKNGVTPFIDIAYQGFGDGLEADAAGVRLVASSVPEAIIAASCSKNFGIYRERTGLLMTISETAEKSAVTQQNLTHLNRQNFSFPPDHGARLVTMILEDAGLRSEWETELEEVRLGMLKLREGLSRELSTRTGSDKFGFIAEHRGMFSRLGATPEQVEKMRVEHGIYMVGDSRMNIAGLNDETVPLLAEAIAAVGV